MLFHSMKTVTVEYSKEQNQVEDIAEPKYEIFKFIPYEIMKNPEKSLRYEHVSVTVWVSVSLSVHTFVQAVSRKLIGSFQNIIL